MTIPKPRITFERLFYQILIITVLILLFKQCTKQPPSASLAIETEKKKAIDSSNKVLLSYKDSVTKVIAQRDDRIDSIEGEAEVYRYERNTGWATIKDRDNVILSLSSKVLDENGKDTTDCIEIAKQSQLQSKRLQEQEGITVKLLDDLHLLAKVKDSTLQDQIRIKDAALKQGLKTATAYSELFAKFEKVKEGSSSVWVGPEMQLSPSYQTVGGQIMYATKKGTGWQFGAGITTDANYYIKMGLLFKISLRKK